MALLESIPEIAVGVAVELFVLGIAAGVIYRFFAGRFLIPKRENILPNQCGVIVQGGKIVRVAEPGSCWIRPKQRIVLCDMRPRPLQMAGLEVVCNDGGIVRLSISVQYRISDAAAYYLASSNPADAIFVELRRIIATLARLHPASVVVAAPDAISNRIREASASAAATLGLDISHLDIWEALFAGKYSQGDSSPDDLHDASNTLVH